MKNKNIKKMSPHDHDLLECGAGDEVPKSIQSGRRHNLRNLQRHDLQLLLSLSLTEYNPKKIS